MTDLEAVSDDLQELCAQARLDLIPSLRLDESGLRLDVLTPEGLAVTF